MDLKYFAYLNAKKAEATVLDRAAERERYAWVPACGGTEVPFMCHGHKLHYMWNYLTKEHAYYDCGADRFLTKDAMEAIL
jgi:hypothetical protein